MKQRGAPTHGVSAGSVVPLALKLLAPYLSVALFWFGFKSGWLTILSYHLQILLWTRRTPMTLGSFRDRTALLGLPMLGAGPLLFLLLPHVSRVELSGWLQEFHLTGWSLMLMIPYFGIVHPLVEQRHWGPLREETRLAHGIFAGYHILVLFAFLRWPWLIVCGLILAGASYVWQHMARRTGGLAGPVASHIGADLGIITAAWLRVSGH